MERKKKGRERGEGEVVVGGLRRRRKKRGQGKAPVSIAPNWQARPHIIIIYSGLT
jgi:hypothetical protein